MDEKGGDRVGNLRSDRAMRVDYLGSVGAQQSGLFWYSNVGRMDRHSAAKEWSPAPPLPLHKNPSPRIFISHRRIPPLVGPRRIMSALLSVRRCWHQIAVGIVHDHHVGANWAAGDSAQ